MSELVQYEQARSALALCARVDEAKAILRREMLTLPKWAEGLPLQSEESVCARYTKSKITLSRGGKS